MKSCTPLHRPPLRALVALLCVGFVFAGCRTWPPPSPQVRHVVLIWLQHPDRPADRAQLIRAARSLRMVRGVQRVETGRAVPDLPAGVDRSFDLGVVITFRDRAALERFAQDPRHLAMMRRYLRPLVKRHEIYNFGGR